jgi:hypothetical protein
MLLVLILLPSLRVLQIPSVYRVNEFHRIRTTAIFTTSLRLRPRRSRNNGLLKSNQDVDSAIELWRDRIVVVSIAPSTALIALSVRVITIVEVGDRELISGAVL